MSLDSVESSRFEDKNKKSYLTDKQKKAIKKVMNESKNELKKTMIDYVDRSFTQTAAKIVIAIDGESVPKKKKDKKKTMYS